MTDVDPFEHAITQMITAMGLDPDDSDLVDTPVRVTEMWRREFLSGYEMEPREILGRAVAEEVGPDAVVITDLAFHSLCPHHLVPFFGRAHVAYIPDGRLLGFGRISRLVACFTQRLTLQERATHQIAQALIDYLPAKGAGCVMQAKQLCLAIPSDRNRDSHVVTSAFLGELKDRTDLRERLMRAVRRTC